MTQRPTLYPNHWSRTVEGEGVKTPLGLKETCNWLSGSKRSLRRLPLPAPHALAVPLLSCRTLKAVLVVPDRSGSTVALRFAARTGKRHKASSSDRRYQ